MSNLLRSVPWHGFEPQQSLIPSDNPPGPAHIRAAAMDDGMMAWIYFPDKQEATVDLTQMASEFGACLFDPSSGEVQEISNYEAAGKEQCTFPFEEDALLIFGPPVEGWLDDDLIRIIVLVVGSLLVLVLLFLIIRQIKTGIG